MNTHHSKVASMRSVEEKIKHYRYEEVLREGREAAAEKCPCALIPEKYHSNKELADIWYKGFCEAIKK
jgi:hypothetical protein